MSTSQTGEDQPSGWRKLYRKHVPHGVRHFVRQGIILAPYHARRLVRRGVHAITGATGLLKDPFDKRAVRSPSDDEAGPKRIDSISHYGVEAEERSLGPSAIADQLILPKDRLDRNKSALVVVCHEASRTGAPILGWNIVRALAKRFNVIVVLVKGGPLEFAFEQCAAAVVKRPDGGSFHDPEAAHVARRIVEVYRPLFVIANSVETRSFVPGFAKADVPVIALAHEFSGNSRPLGILDQVYEWAAHIVFSAKLVEDASRADYPVLNVREVSVIAQGRCEVPSDEDQPQGRKAQRSTPPNKLKRANEVLVVGMGTVQIRKGVDLFIAIAADVLRIAPDSKIRFAWIGQGYNPKYDLSYSAYLAEQITRSGLKEDDFAFADEVDDLDPIYAQSDILLLSSRLDPLPNVAIDAMLHGIPVICFQNATGIAEVLSSEEVTRSLVVPYMDIRTAAETIVELANSPAKLQKISGGVKAKAGSFFSMDRYLDALEQLGRKHADAWKQIARDRDVIESAQAFDQDFYLPLAAKASGERNPLLHYLVRSHILRNKRDPIAANYLRRPCIGFHPLIYACENPAYDEKKTREDPFAHFLRTGKPAGRWCNRVIRIPEVRERGLSDDNAPRNRLRVALHGHFHHSELVPDMMMRLKQNRQACDLFISTTATEKVKSIRAATHDYENGKVEISVVPNKGRDIGAFLVDLSTRFDKYDVVGHVHGKRSVIDGDNSMGERWRNFLWTNLIGNNETSSMENILSKFAEDESLGLVFPEDPNLVSWGDNLSIAQPLVRQMGLGEVRLPPHFDFPVGTMFWARPAALAPFKRLGLNWKDYPKEPVPYDGTILHGIERLVPFVAQGAGYTIATTCIRGVTR